MTENTAYFMNAQVADSFGTARPEDELMHREAMETNASPALVETVFTGFNVPEADIHCLNYIWLHPNLRLMSGGVWAWQGHKRTQLEAELFDMRDFEVDAAITDDGGDLDDVTLVNGFRHQVTTPLEEVRVSYEDAKRGNGFDVTMRAVMPPAMLPSNKHFDQMMRTSGTLRLRGEEYPVDGYAVRDRSWGEARTEDPADLSPLHWIVAPFSDDYIVHVCGLEDPETAEWRDRFSADPARAQAMNRGWVFKDGRLLTVQDVRIQTEWDRAGRRQAAHDIVLTDETGQVHHLKGELTASAHWHTWSNYHGSIGLARWESDGKVCHGDSQVAMWTDFVRAAFTDDAVRVG